MDPPDRLGFSRIPPAIMPRPIPPIQVTPYTATPAVGVGKAALREAVAAQRSGLRQNDFGPAPLAT